MLRIAVLVVVMLCAAAPALAADNDGAILRRQAQELMDAVTYGNAKVWDKYLDPQVVYIDEAGEVSDKPGLIAQIKPLPEGISGSIKTEVTQLHFFGDTAVMHVDDHESENYFGQTIKAEYRSLQTWRRTGDGWKLIGAQVYAGLIDPASIKLPAARLDEYAGVYRLNAQVTYTLRRDGDKLIGQRSGRDPVTLAIEASDVFFVPGQPRSRKIILRDQTGRITGFADRREGRDILWTRER
jgi:ketosteroid isomerase-like protein